MASKKKTKTTSNQTATTTPNVPDWILKPYQDSATAVGGLQGGDPMRFAPGSTPSLDAVWKDASGMQAPDYSGATGLLSGVNYDFDPGNVQGAIAADGMGRYRDLFDENVTNPVMADYEENAGQVRAAQAASGARNGAFRGARFGLREGQTEGELARGRSATYGGLLRDAANFALTGASGDAGRIQSAAEGNASRGLSAQTAGTSARLQGAGLLSDITSRQGADQRATLDMRGRFASQEADLQNKIKQYPIEVQQKLQGLLAGLNPQLFTGQTINSSGSGTSTTSGMSMSDIAKMAQAAAMVAASDVRLKRDIVKVGTRADGLGVYVYRYLWSPILQAGVMAQEVLKVKPEAVLTMPNGFYAVDYGKL